VDSAVRFNVSADTSQFQSGMRQVDNVAQTTAGRIKSAFGGMAGVLAGGAALAGLKSMMNDFDRVGKLATRFATSAESIQRVGVAAKIAGTDVEAVANAMTKAGIAASKAVENGGQMAELFDRAGINAREFAKANIDEKLLMIAEAYRAAGNDAQKTNAIIEIMGSRAGANLIPLISNVEALRAEMANTATVSDETVRKIEAANDRMTRFGNTMKVAAAEGIGLFTTLAERIGSLIGGGDGLTVSEMENEQMRASAEARLRARGELLPDDTQRGMAPMSFGGGVVADVEQDLPGPNAEENVRRINAELEKMRAELAAADEATTGITENTQEEAEVLGETAILRKALRDIALDIREAEAAGNDEALAQLRDYEAFLKAAQQHEGDLGAATRDVNAQYKERLRLQEQSLQKAISAVEKEVELAETMAFGSEEAKSRAQWMKVYSDILEKTGREDLAHRAANAATASSGGGGGGGGGGVAASMPAGPASALEALQNVESSASKAALSRIEGRMKYGLSEAAKLEARGLYSSAQRVRDRLERQAEDRAEDAFRKIVGGSWKSEAQRQREAKEAEESAAGGRSGGGGAGETIDTIAQKILTEIKSRLPVVALGT
jgi:hypothetical protein